MHRLNYLFLKFIVLSMLSIPVIEAAETESIFQEANQYTVKVTTRVQVPFEDDEKGSSIGTGFLVDAARGWILTNAHVASRSPSVVRISFKGGRDIVAKKLYVDPLVDMAILQVPTDQIRSHVKAAQLQCKTISKAGNSVGAFGHPWGFDYTATMGIVSGYTYRWGMYLLQTDTPVNHGNSGGPLISMKNGKIIGIATAMLNKDSAKRMNFAVPIEYACKIIHLMKKGKDPSPPDLPVVFFDAEDKGKPLKIAKVYVPSPSFPLQVGDEILQVGNERKQVSNLETLIHLLRGNSNDFMRLKIKRSGKKQTVKLQLTPMKKIVHRQGVYVSGLLIADVPFIDRKELVPENKLMVHDVEIGSVAESMKIKNMDFLVSVNNKPYQNVDELYFELEKLLNAKEKAHFIFKRMTSTGAYVFGYHEVDLQVAELRFIGGGNNVFQAAKRQL